MIRLLYLSYREKILPPLIIDYICQIVIEISAYRKQIHSLMPLIITYYIHKTT